MRSSIAVLAWVVSVALSGDDSTPLQPGVPLTRAIASGESHRYVVPVRPGDFVHITAQQKDGANVAIAAAGVNGDNFSEADQSAEELSLIAEESSELVVQITSPLPGSYTIDVETRFPTERDRTEAAAYRALSDALAAHHDRDPARVRASLPRFDEAIALFRSIGHQRGLATALASAGTMRRALRESAGALQAFEELLTLTGVEQGWQVGAHTEIGSIYENLGHYQKALEHFSKALAAADASPLPQPPYMRGTLLQGFGHAYASLGERAKALDYYEKSLAEFRKTTYRNSEGGVLHNIGQLHDEWGDPVRALEFLEQALAIHRKAGHSTRQALTLAAIAKIRGARGETEAAMALIDEALALIKTSADPRLEALILDELAELHLLRGDLEKARKAFDDALAIQRRIGDRWREAASLYGIARLEKRAGRLTEARNAIDRSIEIVRSIRQDVEPRDLRLSFRAATADYYETQIEILMALHEREPDAQWAARAFEASEGARARVLVETLHELRAGAPGSVPPALLARDRDLRARLADKERARMSTLSRNASAQVDAIDREIRDILGELHGIEAQIRRSSPRYAALVAPEPLSLARVQRDALDAETAILEFALGATRSFAWLITSEGVARAYVLADRATIDRAAVRLHTLLSAGEQRKTRHDVERAASALGELLLAHVNLPKTIHRLVIVPDGSLHHVPFAMLPSRRGKALIDDYELAMIPSASTLLMLREVARTPDYRSGIAVFADPVFSSDDARVTGHAAPAAIDPDLVRSAMQAGTSLQRLPATRREANDIRRIAPGVRTALDFDASRQTMLGESSSRHSILHVATHALLNSQEPELSGIVLSLVDRKGQAVDGFVRAHDLYALDLDSDLVVLSACRTATGKELRGEGVVGLLSGFMYAGAPRIVASYWDVKDQATAVLMKHFYKAMMNDGKSPAAALRQAQLMVRNDPRWKAPYYWAGFALHGEFR